MYKNTHVCTKNFWFTNDQKKRHLTSQASESPATEGKVQYSSQKKRRIMSSFNTKNTFKFLVILKISLIKMIGLKCVEKIILKKNYFFLIWGLGVGSWDMSGRKRAKAELTWDLGPGI
jgi:hypothetical protein